MSSTTFILIGVTYYIVAIIIIILVLNLINKKEKKKYQTEINTLERDKNLIISASILSELNKVEALINNDKLQERYEEWKNRFKEIKDYKKLQSRIAKVELEIYCVKSKANFLLDEIKEITLSEERNRETITKLKAQYREITNKYNSNKNDYKEVSAPLE